MKSIAKVVLTCALLVPFVGCREDYVDPINTWDDNFARDKKHTQERYDRMVDAAMLQDLSLTDIHFVPHTDVLNDLGESRLRRYSNLLYEYGGVLYLESASLDKEFGEARVTAVVAFLGVEGIEEDRIAVQSGMARARGIAAAEAIEVKLKQYDPNREPLTDIIEGGTGGEFGD